MTRFKIFSALTLTCFAILGCGGGGSTVTGEVSFNGKPLEKGYVTFNPTDGKSAPVGAEVVGGRYTAKNVAVGKNKVVVVSTAVSGPAPETMDAAIAEAKKAKGGPTADAPTDKSEGNNQEHDIPAGSHTLDLKLRASVSSDGKVR
ncbi:hypothetical protein R5W23_001782 [Gemmata sp. JC673]|uniref:Carboxypeptidase regulatory-like domain-containing protein n=1 Tax=Gemmata algarum TaxID=2975278 RepID=A0ABU5F132_9BACT|nr:hypothetical protein [Gemmata algarum]MDY3560547.1 hypothetical protein [Gemmata algarum]